MYRALILLVVTTLYAVPAMAAPVVVWLEQDLPEERYLRRAENTAGEGAVHLAHVDLAYPPQPWSESDERAYQALRAELIEARAIWDQFDVELGIARDLEPVLDDVTLVRDRRDVEEVVDALLFQGAAVAFAWPPTEFREGDEAEPFRATVPGARVNRPWLDALAMAPDRQFTKGDIADGGPWPQFESARDKVSDLPPGYLDLAGVPRGATVVVDGETIERGLQEVELRPGTHYLHVIRNDVVSGRQQVRIEVGRSTDAPMKVDLAELGRAAQTVSAGPATDLPADVEASLQAIADHYQGDVYVAALQDGRLDVRPWGERAPVRKRPVTVLATGEIGGTLVVSSLFDEAGGEQVTAPAAYGGLGLEIGIFNAALLGGFDLAFTPGRTITHGASDGGDDQVTSVLPHGWGGLGAYILRPNRIRPTLLIAGTYGWYGPAHTGFGGRVTLGIPIDEGGTWFRLTTGGATSPDVVEAWDEGGSDIPLHLLFLRMGFGTRF